MTIQIRKNIITGLACLLSIYCCAQDQKTFTIKGSINGVLQDTTVYLIINGGGGDTLGIATSKKGKFVLKGDISKEYEWVSVRLAGTEKWPSFLLESKKLSITGDADTWAEATVKGSKETAYMYELKEKQKTAGSGQLSIKEKFIDGHPGSVYVAWLIKSMDEFSMEQKQQAYEKLTASVKQSRWGVELRDHIEALKLRSQIKEGVVAPDFKVQTIEGNIISLKEVVAKNKFTLVDFWTSWCKPCRELMPTLKKIYEDFHSQGLEILSISSDRNKAAWKKAVAAENPEWLQATAIHGEVNPASIFDAQYIPAFALLNSERKIVAVLSVNSSIPVFGFDSEKNLRITIYETVKRMMEKKE